MLPSSFTNMQDNALINEVLATLLQNEALAQVDRAIQLISPHLKAAYNEAQRRCPGLIQSESDPIRFLLYSNLESTTAAMHLVTYWRKRLEVFGVRAFLPLDLSGNGAYTTEDINLIKQGCYIFPSEDIVYLDRQYEIPGELSFDSQIRRMFFVGQMLSSRATAVNGIHYIMKGFRPPKNKAVSAAVMQLFRMAFPFFLKGVHFIFLPEDSMYLKPDLVTLIAERLGVATSLVRIHICQVPSQAGTKLAACGILPRHLPPELGGSYNGRAGLTSLLLRHGLPDSLAITVGPMERSHLKNDSQVATVELASVNVAERTNLMIVHEMPQLIDNALNELEQTIQLLPQEQKAGYEKALQYAPDLVEQESTPLTFLRYAKFDNWSAAKRLTQYWEQRIFLFGEQAFLPMALDGALGTDGRKALEQGYIFMLSDDTQVRSVLCYDFSKVNNMDLKDQMKIHYFIMNRVMKNPLSVRDGFEVLVFWQDITLTDDTIIMSWWSNAKKCADIIKQTFPLRPASIHLIHRSCDNVASIVPWILPLFDSHKELNVYSEDAVDEIAEKFQSLGIRKEGLPRAMGGNADQQVFLSRRQEEEYKDGSPGNSSGLAKMRIALDQMSLRDKEAYVEALEKDPALVEKESNFSRFLCYNQGNPLAAAEMLVKYWKVRKEVFGDRAYLPMHQTLEGALERKDVSVLQTGYLVQLPCRAGTTTTSVLYCEGAKLQKSSSRQSRLRCFFYIMSIIMMSDHHHLCSILYAVADPSFDRAFKECVEVILPVMPVKVGHVHLLGVINTPKDGGVVSAATFLKTEMEEVKRNLDLATTMSASTIHTHVSSSRENILQSLLKEGFIKAGLPKSFCGLWGYDEFVKWQELRIRHEWCLFMNSREEEVASLYLIPRNKLTVDESEAEKSERKRRMAIVLARKKRERQRSKVESLKEDTAVLEEQQRKLQRENEHLQGLLEQANEVVFSKETSYS